MRKTLFILILAALVAAPTFAAGDWTDVATVVSLHGTIDASGVYLTHAVLDDGVSEYAVICNFDARESPQVCDGLQIGVTYTFVGSLFHGGEESKLRVTGHAPAEVVETPN